MTRRTNSNLVEAFGADRDPRRARPAWTCSLQSGSLQVAGGVRACFRGVSCVSSPSSRPSISLPTHPTCRSCRQSMRDDEAMASEKAFDRQANNEQSVSEVRVRRTQLRQEVDIKGGRRVRESAYCDVLCRYIKWPMHGFFVRRNKQLVDVQREKTKPTIHASRLRTQIDEWMDLSNVESQIGEKGRMKEEVLVST